jgi:apolipoprotein N-acyltransferase
MLHRYSSGWRADLVALLAGAVTPLAFAPLGWWPLAMVGPALLFTLWLFSDLRNSTRRGAMFGVGFFGVGISWVFISIHYHGYVGLPLSLFLTALLVAVMALFPALLGYLIARFFPSHFEKRYTRIKLLLVMPAAWALLEWVRGWFLTGFPWLALGYSQTDSLLAGWASWVGVFGLSWIVALNAALLAALLLDRAGRFYYVLGLLAIWLLAYPMQKSYWSFPHGAPIKAALLQGNVSQDTKWSPDSRLPTIELYTELTRQNWGADLIIWPETALPAFYDEVEGFLDDLEQEARQHGSDLLIGMLSYGENGYSYYNSMVSLGPDSEGGRAMYHKNHLVPFTEYLPMRWLLGGVVNFMQVPMSDFSRGGDEQRPLAVAGQHAGISICYEDAFGEEMIRALPEATFLVNVSNDAWFDGSWAAPQHMQMARMRALEAERPMLRGTNTGISAIIDAKGRVQARAPQFEIAVTTAAIQPRSGMTLYAITGNWLIVTLMAVLLGVAWRLGGRREMAV